MAELQHICIPVTTVVQKGAADGTDWVDVDGAAISSSAPFSDANSWDVGATYLVWVQAQFSHGTSTAFTDLRVLHGSTPFADSEIHQRPNSNWLPYSYPIFWTAVSGEGIKLQVRRTTGTASVDQIGLLAVKLTGNATLGTHYFNNERSTDDSLTTTITAGGQVTLTPASQRNYLILAYTQTQVTSTSASYQSHIADSVAADTEQIPAQIVIEGSDTAEIIASCLVAGKNLTAVETTITEYSRSVTSNNGTRLHSRVMLLDLTLFRNHVVEHAITGTVNLGNTMHATNLDTTSITPDVQGDVVAIGFCSFDRQNAGREIFYRLQIDDADGPATQSDDDYSFWGSRDARDEFPCPIFHLQNLTAAAHTIDLDGSSDSTTGTPLAKDIHIVAFTLELPAAGGAVFQKIVGSRFGLASAGGLAA